MKPYWQGGGITVYHGDWREVGLKQRMAVTLVDPPWPWEGSLGPQQGLIRRDTTIIFGAPLVASMRLFGEFAPDGVCLWLPDMSFVQQTKAGGEITVPIWYWGKVKCPVVLREPFWGLSALSKPIAMMHMLLQGRSVLDPMCGTGSALVAAIEAGVEGIGIDRNEEMCRETVRRCEAAIKAKEERQCLNK